MLQCVAVCCSVLQCVALSRSEKDALVFDVCLLCVFLLQCVAVCCSVLQCCSALQCVAVCVDLAHTGQDPGSDFAACHRAKPRQQAAFSLQCGAVCCSVLKCVAVCCSVR